MTEFLAFLEHYGILVLFLVTLVDQLGLPLPSGPMLVAAGALVGLGRLNPAAAVAAALVPTLLADWIWYELGRHKGTRVLRFLCRVSLEPDSCVRNTENLFSRHGDRALLVARFVPGLSTVAPPLAGIFGVSPVRFLAFDAVGTLLWIATFGGLGCLFSDRLDDVADWLSRLGTAGLVVVAGPLALYVAFKWWHRQQFLRQLRIDRISPEDLHELMERGAPILVVDLRHRFDFEANPVVIPGAIVLPAEELEARVPELLVDQELILYCT